MRPAGACRVALTGFSDPSTSAEVSPTSLSGGGLADVFVRPTADLVVGPLTISIQATVGQTVSSDSVTGEVIDMGAPDRTYADSLLGEFLTYFEAQRPEMGLGPAAQWVETFDPQSVLVVSHMLYLSDAWELHLAWHNTISPMIGRG